MTICEVLEDLATGKSPGIGRMLRVLLLGRIGASSDNGRRYGHAGPGLVA